jgi:hypothetical protein
LFYLYTIERLFTDKDDELSKIKIMKATVIMIIAVFFFWNLEGSKVSGQTVAIGHVFAEVVEAVSVSSATISNFELAKTTESISTNLSQETLNLGTVTINSGKDYTCGVVLKPANVSDSFGNGFSIEPVVKNELLASVAKSNGTQTIQLGGMANKGTNQASGLYAGSYTVIFAYN